MKWLSILALLFSLNLYAGDKIPVVKGSALSIAIDETGVHFTASHKGAALLNQRLIVDLSKEPIDLVEVKVDQASEEALRRGAVHTLVVTHRIKSREAGSGLATGRKSGSIILQDREGNEVMRINLYECFPTKRKVIMDRDTGYIVEEIEFVVEKVERA